MLREETEQDNVEMDKAITADRGIHIYNPTTSSSADEITVSFSASVPFSKTVPRVAVISASYSWNLCRYTHTKACSITYIHACRYEIHHK